MIELILVVLIVLLGLTWFWIESLQSRIKNIEIHNSKQQRGEE